MSAGEFVERARRFLLTDVWTLEGTGSRLTNAFLRALQFVILTAEGFYRDKLLLRASALTYITALAVVPLLAVVLGILRLVGADQKLADMAIEQIAMGSPDTAQMIGDLVRNANFAQLGTLGATMLLLTTVLSLRHLEKTLNDIWGVRDPRSWLRRLSDYLAVMVIAPLLTGTAVSLATTLQSQSTIRWLFDFPLFARLYSMGLSHLPAVLLLAGFTFLYGFFPNTRVRWRSALVGGLVATVLFSLARSLYVDFYVGAARYSVLFGSAAALPLLLGWLYFCWAIVLLGAEVSYASQNLAQYRREMRLGTPCPAEREALGLHVAVQIARHFRDEEPPPTAESMCERLEVSVRAVRDLLAVLEDGGLVIQTTIDDEDAGYVPARPLDRISVGDVLRRLRGGVEGAAASPFELPHTPGEVDRILDELAGLWLKEADAMSLAAVLERSDRSTEPADA